MFRVKCSAATEIPSAKPHHKRRFDRQQGPNTDRLFHPEQRAQHNNNNMSTVQRTCRLSHQFYRTKSAYKRPRLGNGAKYENPGLRRTKRLNIPRVRLARNASKQCGGEIVPRQLYTSPHFSAARNIVYIPAVAPPCETSFNQVTLMRRSAPVCAKP